VLIIALFLRKEALICQALVLFVPVVIGECATVVLVVVILVLTRELNLKKRKMRQEEKEKKRLKGIYISKI